MRVLSLYLPYWPIERIRRRWPASRRREPLLLVERRHSTQFVAARSVEAAARGVRPGMTLAHARALVPQAAEADHDPAADAAALAALGGWAMRFSPSVSLDPPHGLLLDVTGCRRLFRGEDRLVALAVAALGELGFTAFGAIADTAGAAWAVAHGGGEPCRVVAEGQVYAALAPLPPWTLRISDATAAQLDALGIQRIESLLMLPRALLPARFGEELLLRVDQALGRATEVLALLHQPVEIAARMNFEFPVNRPEVLDLVLCELVEQVARRLAQLGRGARRVEAAFFPSRRMPLRCGVTLCAPNRSPPHLIELLRARMREIDPGLGFDAVEVAAPQTAPIAAVQGEFFAAPRARCEPAAAELFDRLAARLGPYGVVLPRAVESHWPEKAWTGAQATAEGIGTKGRRDGGTKTGEHGRPARANGDADVAAPSQRIPAGATRLLDQEVGCVPDAPVVPRSEPSKREGATLTPALSLQGRGGHFPALPTAPALRPLRLLPRPQPIRVIAAVPDQPPTWFQIAGREHRTRAALGPERLAAEWWADDAAAGDADGIDAAARDYYQVEDAAGARFWVYRESPSNRWFLHGVFE